MSWSTEFEDPIELPNGRKLVTLRDAATYITKLPKADHTAPEWQAAMEALQRNMPGLGVVRARVWTQGSPPRRCGGCNTDQSV